MPSHAQANALLEWTPWSVDRLFIRLFEGMNYGNESEAPSTIFDRFNLVGSETTVGVLQRTLDNSVEKVNKKAPKGMPR